MASSHVGSRNHVLKAVREELRLHRTPTGIHSCHCSPNSIRPINIAFTWHKYYERIINVNTHLEMI